MKLQKLHIVNYGIHSDLVIAFPDNGLCVIQGPNGTGKSNILKALQFVLTGVTPNVKKLEALKWDADEGRVELTFEANGKKGHISRQLHSSKALLNYDGQIYSKLSDIDACINDLLGAAKNLSDNFVFVKQGDTTAILDARPSERNVMLHKLLGTDRFQAIYALATTELNFYTGKLNGMVLEDLSKLTAEHSDAVKRVDVLNAELKGHSLDVLRSTETSLQQIVITCHSIAADLNNPATGLSASLKTAETLQTKLNNLTLQKSAVAENVSNCLTREHLAKEKIAESVALSTCRQKLTQIAKQKELLTRRSEAVTECTAKHSEIVAVHGSYITYSEATAKQAEALKVKQEAALNLSIEQAKLTSFKDGVCPTCGTDTVIKGTEHLHLSDLVEKATFAVNTYTQAVNNTTKIYEYYTKLVSLLTQEIGLKQKLDGLDAQLAAFKDLDETQLNNEIAVIQDKLAYLDKQLQNVDELLNNLNTLDKELSATNAAIEHITTHLSGLIQKETKLSQTNLIKLETELAVCRAEIKQLSLAEAELNALEQKLLPSINARLETLHKTLKQRNVIESYCGCLEQIKQALHPTKLPQALASVYFSRLNASWNQLLSQLDVPFTVELLADSTIQVKFSNNQSAITEQLSGGQRCCLALSFLLTVSSLFNQSVGFIALDEPTYGLDSDHLDRVADLFTNLQTYTTSKNIQMLVVTHEDKLKTYAPYVISL